MFGVAGVELGFRADYADGGDYNGEGFYVIDDEGFAPVRF